MALTAKGLAKLIEELGELQQVCGKKLAYMDTDNHPDGKGSLKVRMEEEMGDVAAACRKVLENFGLDEEAIIARAEHKYAVLDEWDNKNG